MKRFFAILQMLLLFGCVSKTKSKEEMFKNRIDTLMVKSYLNNPIDTSINVLNEVCIEFNDSNTVLPRMRYQCFYVVKQDTVAEITFSVFKTDSTWTFGSKGYQIEKFECDDRRVSFQKGLGIGKRLVDFEQEFGEFKIKGKNVYLKTFLIDDKEITLTLKTNSEIIEGITIVATNR